MKLFVFCMVSVASLWALPPLPPLPPLPALPSLPSIPAASVSTPSSVSASSALPALLSTSSLAISSSATVPAPAASPATDEQRPAPIMVDEKTAALKNIKPADDEDRAKKLEDILKQISDIQQQVNTFQGAEQEIDGLYAAVEKKVNDFFVVVDGFVGKTGGYVEDLERDIDQKKTELNAALVPGCSAETTKGVADALKAIEDAKPAVAELKKLLESAKDGRSAIAREEDVVRQKVVDFKKNSGDIAAFYTRAVTAKNGLLVGGGDAAGVLSQCADSLKKAQDMVSSLQAKGGQEIKDSLKKIEGLLTSGQDAQKTIETKLADLKNAVVSFSKIENGLLVDQMADLAKKENVILPKKSDDQKNAAKKNGSNAYADHHEITMFDTAHNATEPQEPVLGVREDMFREVLSTVQQGALLLFGKTQEMVATAGLVLKEFMVAHNFMTSTGASGANQKDDTVPSIAVAVNDDKKSKADSLMDKKDGPEAVTPPVSAPLVASIGKLADKIVTENEQKSSAPASVVAPAPKTQPASSSANLPSLPPLPALPSVQKSV